MKLKFNGILVLLLVLMAQLTFAQERAVTGVVSDNAGQPIPGVSVLIKGTNFGTQTDFDGKFAVKATPSQILIFSYIGMKTQEIKASSVSINVAMLGTSVELEGVVVTAVGVTRKERELGYNVQTVKAEDIRTKPNADVVNSLAGATSGVSIISSAGDAGASTFMTIRGASSITGNNQPLFIVNGMPVITGGGYSGTDGVNTSSRSIDINPDDIATISILKGGAATALYGVRAANGAVIITTKSGKNLTSKKIEFTTSVGFASVTQLPARQKKYSQGFDGTWKGGDASSFGAEISQLEYDGDTSYKWDPNGRLVPSGTGNGTPGKYYDPYDYFQTGLTTNNALNISNGNEDGSFYFSLSNLEQEGVVPNNQFGRTTMRLNATTKLTEMIDFGVDMSYTNSRAVQIQKGSNVSGVMLGLLRTASTFDNSAGYEFPDGTQRNYRNGGGYDNPYWVSNNIKFDEDVNRFTGGANFKIKFSDFFNISYNGGVDWYSRRYIDQFKIGSRGFPDGQYSEVQQYQRTFNSDLLFNFKKDFSEDFTTTLTLGNNFYGTYSKGLAGVAKGLSIPDFYQLSNTSSNTTAGSTSQQRTMAVFADLQFAYKNMLYLGFTGRNDWSTTMPASNDDAFYPSASLGFIFTEIAGLKNNSVLSFGKLRGSAARVANIAGPYNTSNYYQATSTADGWTTGVEFPYQAQTGFQVSPGLGNPDLKHETQDSWEVGADLRFFSNRFGIDFTYFSNKNSDLLMSVPLAPSSGFQSVFLNAASMESKGIEISITASPIKTKNFNWDLLTNFTKFSNTVTSLADGVDNIALPGGFTTPQVRAVVGRQYGSVFGEDWYRDANGAILINDDPTDSYRDGYPMTNTKQGLVPIGDTNPDWTANITNTFSYKNLSFSFLIDVKSGGQMYNGTAFAMNYFGTSERTVGREVYYTADGSIDFTKTPAENIKVFDGVYGHVDANGDGVSNGTKNVTPIVEDQAWYRGQGSNFGGGPSSAAMEPAGWVRLRDISLSYTFPKLSKNIKDLNIFISGKNLWIDTPYTGVDPETSLSGAGNGQGMDYFNNPGSKSYTLGLKMTF
ncbi:SusC/RagA family TonB-linked outer membrane protein [Flavobacterium sp. W22_SRS_FP1]|uniref:SusC/RagA family TonB-linked outer membrane protein n=1 Tax=Flavobacterium sp. W22_SRS_FP1 TaxID=3240276 RepID=UPI003F8E3EF4